MSRDVDDDFISFVVLIPCSIASHPLYTNFSYLNSRYTTSWMGCSPRLTTRKRGEGVNHLRSPKQLHQQSCPKPGIPLIRERVLLAPFFRDHSGTYYSKTGSVIKTVSPSASFTKSGLCGYCSEATSTHFSLQREDERTEPGVLPSLNVLQPENGGSGPSRRFDDSDLRRTVTTRQRRVIDSEDGI